MPDQLVTLKVFSTEVEAEMVKGRLLSEGIEAFVFKDDCGGMYPQLRLSQGVSLKVPSSQAARATDILNLWDPDPDGHDEEVNDNDDAGSRAEIVSLLAWFFGTLGLGLLLLSFFRPDLFYIGLPLLLVSFIVARLFGKE
ncbi:MAG: putative signal transducing protein [Desulfosudaceae bacterium]